MESSSRERIRARMKGVGMGVGSSGVCDDIGSFVPVAEVMAVAGDAMTLKGQQRMARYRPNLRLYSIVRAMMVMLIANGIDNDRAFAEAVALEPRQN